MPETDTRSDVERIKADSGGLREPLREEVSADTSHFSGDALQILKFHGVYQQDDRDIRRERKRAGREPDYRMMVRSKIPGGVLTAEQYLAHDEISDRYGDGTMRITTRQGIQMHGVLKGDLKGTIAKLNEALVVTLGACGDVERNVLSCPAVVPGGARREALAIVREISTRTLPTTGAYHEIWLNGEKVEGAAPPQQPDPLYGEHYLPRKFKTALAFEDDNCTDILSNDLGLLATVEGGGLEGFEVFVGGGFGMTHNKPETFPRLASALAWIHPEDAMRVTEAVIAVQRDHGNRTRRRVARLKYLIHERGTEWFRTRVEEELGGRLRAPLGIGIREVEDHVGWHAQGDGRWLCGVYVENGRLKDTQGRELRTAVRDLVRRFRPAVHLTPQQNLLFADIADEDRAAFAHEAAERGVEIGDSIGAVRRWSMACPAMPTCGLAIAEAERVMPDLLTELEGELARIGLGEERFSVRMTGCPNGCARPYSADVGIVGRGLDKYTLFLGGAIRGDHLGMGVADLVPREEIVAALRPVLTRFKEQRGSGEELGAFCRRVGPEALAAWVGEVR